MWKRLLCAALCALLCCLCSGCSSYKSDQTFTYLLSQNVTSLDPQTASGSGAETVISSLFEGLCRIDDEGQVVPGVAKKWQANEDSTQFTFSLGTNAQWSDGTPVTAQDFVFGITRALSSSTGTAAEELMMIQNAATFANGEADASALGVVAENDHTLVIRLEESNPDFPALTAQAPFMPCNQAYFEACTGHYGLSSEYLITNGPFTFTNIYAWQTDSGKRSITVTRSETYRGDRKVQPSSITFLIDYDSALDTDPVGALVSGQVDILPVTETQATQAKEQGCGVMTLDDAVTGLLLNPQCDKLKDTTLRSLFFKTLTRTDLLAQRPNAVEAQGIMPACVTLDGEPYYAQGTQAYTLQDSEATQGLSSLLSQLDLEQVPSITVICLDDPWSVAVTNCFLSAWNATLGNAFNLERLSYSEFQSRIASGDYEAALYTLRAGGTTPYDVLRAFESTASPTLLQNDAYDQALLSMEFDLASYQEMENLLMENYVFYPIFQDQTYYATNPDTQGITVSPDQSIDFTNARKR